MFNSAANVCDDQPIDAGLMHESRFLTSWITPGNLGIQEAYDKLTAGITDRREKIAAVWRFVRDIPYVPYVKSRVTIGGKTFVQNDVWLSPAQALGSGTKLNCFNKSVLLASLLRQEMPADQVYVCLNNVTYDGIGGHAVVYLADGDYILESTNPGIQSPFMIASGADMYEAVMFFNDEKVLAVPDTKLSQPLGNCHCVKWLENYVNERLCQDWNGN